MNGNESELLSPRGTINASYLEAGDTDETQVSTGT